MSRKGTRSFGQKSGAATLAPEPQPSEAPTPNQGLSPAERAARRRERREADIREYLSMMEDWMDFNNPIPPYESLGIADDHILTPSDESDSDISDGNIRQEYTRVMDKCRKMERRDGFSNDMLADLKSSIKSASTLFQRFQPPLPPEKEKDKNKDKEPQPSTSKAAKESANRPSSSSQKAGPAPAGFNIASGPGDTYMAFLATKMISDVLRHKADIIGQTSNGFRLDEFLASVKRKALAKTTDSLIKVPPIKEILATHLSAEMSKASWGPPNLTALVGSFDRDIILAPREKKARAPTVRRRFEDVERTQEEIMVPSGSKPDGPQRLALHLDRILRQHCSKNPGKATLLYEFVYDSNSLNKTIESIFYLAFLVHDGVAGLYMPSHSPLKDFALEIKPEKKEKEGNQIANRGASRSQIILSFSSTMFKKMCQLKGTQGVTAIPSYSQFQRQQDQMAGDEEG